MSDRALLASPELGDLLRRALKAAPAEQQPGGGDEVAAATQGAVDGQVLEGTLQRLRDAIGEFEPVWTASAVILPQSDFLALNLDLPFGDPKNLDRIVDLEVQDVVPFELDNFFVQYAPLGASNAAPAAATATQYDVHIGILPRQVVQNVLELCKAAGLEPNVLTVPSSAIGAVYHLAKDFFVGNSAVIFNRGDEYCISVFINGEVRLERSVLASQIIAANSSPERRQENLQHIFTALKLVLASAERRYGTKVEKVYLLGREVKAANASQLFGRPLEGLPMKEVLSGVDSAVGLAPLTAIFAQDDAAAAPLSNFRSRQFSFTPKVSEFIRALAGTRRYVLQALGGIALAAAVVYGSRQYVLHSSEDALVERVRKVIPNFTAEQGKVVEALAKAEGKLGQELSAFGSRSKFSPADALVEVVKVLPSGSGISITALRVTGEKVSLQGTASEVAAVERFSKALGAREDIFAKVDYKNAKTASGFSFTVDIVLAQ
jgi:Tfp pilus assembly PilM family ATPase